MLLQFEFWRSSGAGNSAGRPCRKASPELLSEPGPPGALPSIEQVMPWLHLIFDAWEDHRQKRAQEAAERERAAAEMAAQEATATDDDGANDDDDRKKKHRHKRRKDKK